jgi:hypothetical protein
MASQISMFRWVRPVTPEEFRDALRGIEQAGFRLLLSAANAAYFGAIGVEPPQNFASAGFVGYGSRRFSDGDLVAADDWSEIAYIGRVERSKLGVKRLFGRPGKSVTEHFLEVGSISSSKSDPLLVKLREIIGNALGGPMADNESWQRLVWENKKFDDLRKRGTSLSVSFSDQDVCTSKSLSDPRLWELVTKVKSSGAMLVSDFLKQGAAPEDVETLQTAGLLGKEHAVICRQNFRLINRVPSVEPLGKTDIEGVRCGICNRRLSEERVDELVAPTDLARNLLEHSRWMAPILLEQLGKIGIQRERVLLEYREANEEVDALVDIDGSLVMFELKDKEFSMGHAYPLPGRTAMYHPDYVIVVSRYGVAPDVKSYFDQVKPDAQLKYVEGLDSLPTELDAIANLARVSKIGILLSGFNSLTIGVDVAKTLAPRLGISIPEKETSFSTMYIPNDFGALE